MGKVSDNDRFFLLATPKTDNSRFLGQYPSNLRMSSNVEVAVPAEDEDPLKGGLRVRVVFKWVNGCNDVAGFCIIFSKLSDKNWNEDETNARLTLIGNKLLVEPTAEEDGLTSDNYLPIGAPIKVSDKLSIKPGIYLGTHKRTIVDLIETEP